MSLTKREFERQAEQAAPSARLRRVRDRLRFVGYEIASAEGRVLDYESAEGINRALAAVTRELEELTVSVACLGRRAGSEVR